MPPLRRNEWLSYNATLSEYDLAGYWTLGLCACRLRNAKFRLPNDVADHRVCDAALPHVQVFCTIRTARANRHSAMLWDVGLKSNIRANCRQPHPATSFLIFLRLKAIVLSCYMRPRNDGEPKLEKL